MRRLYLCGASNAEGVRLALRVNERHGAWDEIVLLDDDPAKLGRTVLGVEVIGAFSALAGADTANSWVVSLVARTTKGRRQADLRIGAWGVPAGGLISSDVDLMGAEVAPDLIAYQNATIGPEASLAAGCVVFMGAAVGHECIVGRYCVIAANAVLNARVRLGDGVYVGSGAVVLPEVEVGAGATIGAGAVVIGDVPAGATVVGPTGVLVGVPPVAARPSAGGDTVRELASIWSSVLGVGSVGPDQNFFDLGGTSLLALRMLQQLESRLGIALNPVDLYQYPTIAGLSAYLGHRTGTLPGLEQVRARAESRRTRSAREPLT
jgi:acetyltransferase-like isoleucine patch superfamily enzyme/acyl carrier protein